MSERIFTLFGEEIIPEQEKPVVKTPAAPKKGARQDRSVSPLQWNELLPPENDEAEQRPAEDTYVATPDLPQLFPAYTEPVASVAAEEPQAALVDEVTAQYPEPTPQVEAPAAIVYEDTEPGDEPITTAEPDNNPPFELPEDWKGEKQYYSIGEVAALFKVKTSHIRFWTNDFKINVRTTRKGDRLYTPDQVKELRTIYHLVKERGYTLSGAKAKLKAHKKVDVSSIDLKQALKQLRNDLLAIRNNL